MRVTGREREAETKKKNSERQNTAKTTETKSRLRKIT